MERAASANSARRRVRVGPGGRVVIPSDYRRSLGLKIGDEVLLSLEDGTIRLETWAEAIRNAQELVRKYVPEGVSLVDELIADRRQEAERE